MKTRGINAIIVSLAGLTVLSLAGSSLGTLAWYAYSTRATAAYSGTAVRKTEQLQIGLLWDYPSTSDATATKYKTDFGVTYESVNEKTYCFMPAGQGFSSSAIMAYLNMHGHAANELPPLTSNTYADGSALSLYEAPTAGYKNVNTSADSSHYVELPFAFRIHTTVNSVDTLVRNRDIWLTDATAVAHDAEKDVSEAIRIHVATDATTFEDGSTLPVDHRKYILNPTAATSGNTVVAGLLDLNADGYYDYVDSDDKQEEIIYGVYTGDPTTVKSVADSDYVDINGTGRSDNNRTTFYARHREEVYAVNNYTGLTMSSAHYLCFDDVKPEEHNGIFSGGYPIAHTSDDANSIATTTLKVYLEGWDHCVIDDVINAGFNLGLQFEINRV